jgi:hypothetical protein
MHNCPYVSLPHSSLALFCHTKPFSIIYVISSTCSEQSLPHMCHFDTTVGNCCLHASTQHHWHGRQLLPVVHLSQLFRLHMCYPKANCRSSRACTATANQHQEHQKLSNGTTAPSRKSFPAASHTLCLRFSHYASPRARWMKMSHVKTNVT